MKLVIASLAGFALGLLLSEMITSRTLYPEDAQIAAAACPGNTAHSITKFRGKIRIKCSNGREIEFKTR